MSTPMLAFPQSLTEKYRPRTMGEFAGLEKPKKLASQKHMRIHIYQEGDKVRAVTLIAGRQAFLRKIYVKTRRWELLWTADYFELFGNSVTTGEDCYEKVTPQN